MGSSKSFRKGPQWTDNNTNRGKESAYSRGDVTRPEGTLISGSNDSSRGGMSKKARDKSSSSRKGGPTKY